VGTTTPHTTRSLSVPNDYTSLTSRAPETSQTRFLATVVPLNTVLDTALVVSFHRTHGVQILGTFSPSRSTTTALVLSPETETHTL
jgi:hypothetical protein